MPTKKPTSEVNVHDIRGGRRRRATAEARPMATAERRARHTYRLQLAMAIEKLEIDAWKLADALISKEPRLHPELVIESALLDSGPYDLAH